MNIVAANAMPRRHRMRYIDTAQRVDQCHKELAIAVQRLEDDIEKLLRKQGLRAARDEGVEGDTERGSELRR